MQDEDTVGDAGAAPDDAAPSWRDRAVLGPLTIPHLMLLLVVVGPLVGFLVGMIGAGSSSTTVSVNLVIDGPDTAELQPGTTGRFPVLISNPNDHGVQVASIDAGASQAAGDCPAGAVTSEPVTGPPGYIGPEGVRTYSVEASMAADAPESCQGRSFAVPLTVELVSTG